MQFQFQFSNIKNFFVVEYFLQHQIRNWLVQICFALQYLHKKNILHRDIKAQNIFIASNKLLKLGDFGISKTLRFSLNIYNLLKWFDSFGSLIDSFLILSHNWNVILNHLWIKINLKNWLKNENSKFAARITRSKKIASWIFFLNQFFIKQFNKF